MNPGDPGANARPDQGFYHGFKIAKSKKIKSKFRDLPTQKTIERKTIFEPGMYIDRRGRVAGLRLVVTERGGASWILRYWRDGRSRI